MIIWTSPSTQEEAKPIQDYRSQIQITPCSLPWSPSFPTSLTHHSIKHTIASLLCSITDNSVLQPLQAPNTSQTNSGCILGARYSPRMLSSLFPMHTWRLKSYYSVIIVIVPNIIQTPYLTRSVFSASFFEPQPNRTSHCFLFMPFSSSPSVLPLQFFLTAAPPTDMLLFPMHSLFKADLKCTSSTVSSCAS